MNYKKNVQPIRSKKEIEAAEYFLSNGKNGERNLLLFLFGINTGLRCGDIVRRTCGEVRYNKHPYIIEGKTKKRRKLNLTNLADILDKYVAGKPDDAWLFPSSHGHGKYHLTVSGVYQIFERLGDQMDKPYYGTHTMRKTFGYHFYKQTYDIATLMQIFNHSSQEITKRYIGITEDEIDDSLNDFKIGL